VIPGPRGQPAAVWARGSAGIALVVVIGIASPGASAQFGARAEVAPPIAAGSDVDPTSSATTIELDRRPRALETTDEVLLEAPGARRRRTAGFGGFTSLSLRGAEAEHTAVLLGDVPLATADGSAFDLTTVPPWLFDRIEVYRGGAPVWLGAGAIGGVLRLVPRTARGTRVEAVAGGGQFDLAQGRAAVDVDGRDVSLSSSAGLTYSGGRFPFTYDPDPLVPGTIEREQSNAQLLEAAGLIHARVRAGDATLSLVGLGAERTGGLPPPASRWTELSLSRRSHTRGVIAIASEWLDGGRPPEQADLARWRTQLVVSFGLDRRRFSDPLASYGQLPSEAEQLLSRSTLRSATSFRIAEWIDATVVGSAWHETFDPRDVLRASPLAGSRRDGGAIAVEARIHGGGPGDVRFEVRPSARLELVDAEVREVRAERAGEATTSTAVLPTARVGAVLELIPGIAIQASGATATRAPGAIELFGDGGFLLGDTRLRAERSYTIDGGVVGRGTLGVLAGFAELRGFALWAEDLVRYRRIAQGQIVPENAASASIAGLEASARLEIDRFVSIAAALTWIETAEDVGGRSRQLPFRPRITGYARPTLHVDDLGPIARLSMYVDVDYVGSAFDTPENDVVIPEVARIGIGASIEILARAVRLDLIVRDLFDARGRDIIERPLPGRSFALQLAVRTD
jgi:vitamin B12 transporter